jgi:hypothetical protein
MALIKITKAAWIEHLTEQGKTGLTQTAYCQERGISIAAFRYWKKRHAKLNHNIAQRIVEVPLRSVESNSGVLKLGFPNGCFLHIPAGWRTLSIIELAKAVYHL